MRPVYTWREHWVARPGGLSLSYREQWPFASVSSEITYQIQKEGFDYLDAPIRRITAADAPLHYASNLVTAALPDVPRTVKLVKEVMYLVKYDFP